MHTRTRSAALFACLGLALATPAARAHDTWVLPAAFRLAVGQPISTLLSAGHGLTPLAAPRRRRLRVLQLIDTRGRFEPERWQRGREAAQAHFRCAAPGVACLALGTRETQIELDADTVHDYLCEVQPPAAVQAAWQQQQARCQPWVERYAKDAKSYLRSGRSNTGWPALATLGHALELIPGCDPTRLAVGHTLGVTLRLHGQAWPDAALRLFSPGNAEQVARTNAQGRAAFRLDKRGRHLVATTVLLPPTAPGAPWHTRFATLGFGVGHS